MACETRPDKPLLLLLQRARVLALRQLGLSGDAADNPRCELPLAGIEILAPSYRCTALISKRRRDCPRALPSCLDAAARRIWACVGSRLAWRPPCCSPASRPSRSPRWAATASMACSLACGWTPRLRGRAGPASTVRCAARLEPPVALEPLMMVRRAHSLHYVVHTFTATPLSPCMQGTARRRTCCTPAPAGKPPPSSCTSCCLATPLTAAS